MTAATHEDHDRLVKLSVAEDGLGIMEMVVQNRVLLIENQAPGKVIDRGFMSSEVRVTDGRHVGRAVIVSNEFLRKMKE